jgi:hypothetical protein
VLSVCQLISLSPVRWPELEPETIRRTGMKHLNSLRKISRLRGAKSRESCVDGGKKHFVRVSDERADMEKYKEPFMMGKDAMRQLRPEGRCG